jgi:GTP-binding protein
MAPPQPLAGGAAGVWRRHFERPLHIALTKADKLSRGAALETLRRIGAHLKSDCGGAISLQLFSALKRSGIDEAHAVLDGWLEPLPPDSG